MEGRICLVTGANSGMGRATAAALAKLGAQVVLACRSQAKAEATREAIASESGNAALGCVWGDLSSLARVREMAAQFAERFPRLDVLVNNAGMLGAERTLSEDGIEQTFAVNHLSVFLLTRLLLEKLHASEQGRVVTVASDVHRMYRYDSANLELERGYGAYKAYALSKLANIMFTHELAKVLRGSAVTANCCHPGYVGSNFGRAANPWFRAMMTLSRPFLTTSEKGARTAVYLATSPEVAGVSGKYFKGRRPVAPARIAHDDVRTRELWEISSRMTGLPAD